MDQKFFKDITSDQGHKSYKAKKKELDDFCRANGIIQNQEEFFFEIKGIHFQVSRFAIKPTNAISVKERLTQMDDDDVSRNEIILIKGNKSNIMRIYNDLKDGVEIDFCGNRIGEAKTEEVKVQEPEPTPEPEPIIEEEPEVQITRQQQRQQALNSLFKKR